MLGLKCLINLDALIKVVGDVAFDLFIEIHNVRGNLTAGGAGDDSVPSLFLKEDSDYRMAWK